MEALTIESKARTRSKFGDDGKMIDCEMCSWHHGGRGDLRSQLSVLWKDRPPRLAKSEMNCASLVHAGLVLVCGGGDQEARSVGKGQPIGEEAKNELI